jgi:hypothetical protein
VSFSQRTPPLVPLSLLLVRHLYAIDQATLTTHEESASGDLTSVYPHRRYHTSDPCKGARRAHLCVGAAGGDGGSCGGCLFRTRTPSLASRMTDLRGSDARTQFMGPLELRLRSTYQVTRADLLIQDHSVESEQGCAERPSHSCRLHCLGRSLSTWTR